MGGAWSDWSQEEDEVKEESALISNRGGVGSLREVAGTTQSLVFLSFFCVFIPAVASRGPSPGEEEVSLVPDRQTEAVDVVTGEAFPALTAGTQTQV